MSLRAGFAQVDITPPLGTPIVGWLARREAREIRDPLYARVAVLEDDAVLGIVQLDLLSVEADEVAALRAAAARLGFAGERVMVCTTHTHAGPAACGAGEVDKHGPYVELLLERVGAAFAAALAALEPAELGFGWGFETTVAHNRRVVLRDGTVRTHGHFEQPDAMYLEGPIDPELAVIALRRPGGGLLGALINYTCHPTHHGSDGVISAGFPGVLAERLRAQGCPVPMFIQGAAGCVHFADPLDGGRSAPMGELGERLAAAAQSVLERLEWRDSVALDSRSMVIDLPFREPTADEIAGTVRGAQRFVDPSLYDRMIPALVEEIRARDSQPAEVQVHSLDEVDLVAVPGELFVQLGLGLKERLHPRHGLIAAYSNGRVGYIPHREAFARGGYETTFLGSSCLAPGAGEQIVDAAVALTRRGETP